MVCSVHFIDSKPTKRNPTPQINLGYQIKPPKTKKGKKIVKKVGKKPVLIDGIAVADMTQEALVGHIIRLREELEAEREERNFFQMEKDKINTFWELTKHELEEKKAEIQSKDRALEAVENKHEMEINLYKEKSKYLMFENQKSLNTQQKDAFVALEKTKETFHKNEIALIEQKRNLEKNLEEEYQNHLEILKDTEVKHSMEINEIKTDYSEKIRLLKEKNEQQLLHAKEEFDFQKRKAIEEIESRNNLFIDNLILKHDKEFNDMKRYYKDITVNNVALIDVLKEQLESNSKSCKQAEMQLLEKIKENQDINQSLKDIEAELKRLKPQMENHRRTTNLLVEHKNKVKKLNKVLSEIKVQNEAYRQRCEKLEKERKDIYENFLTSIHEIEQKASFKNVLLEKKLSVLKHSLEIQTSQIVDLMSKFNTEPDTVFTIHKSVENILRGKDQLISELEEEITKLYKSHVETMAQYESKLKKFGLHL